MIDNALFEEEDLLRMLNKKHNKKGSLSYEENIIFEIGNYAIKIPKIIYSYKHNEYITVNISYTKSAVKKLLLNFLKCRFGFIYDVRLKYSKGEIICYLWNILKE